MNNSMDQQQEVVVREDQPDRALWVAVGPVLGNTPGAVVFVTDRETMELSRETALALAAALLAASGLTQAATEVALWARVAACGFSTTDTLADDVEAPQDDIADLAAEAHLRLCQKRRQEKAQKAAVAVVAVAV